MTRDQLIDAFDGIDSRYILAAAARIEGGANIAFRRQRLVRTVLIAAAITALLTATAYATGLFGLSTRRITPDLPWHTDAALSKADAETMEKLRDTHRHSYISLGGVTDSPEYAAAAEWLSWRAVHEQEMAAAQLRKGESYYEWRDLARSFAESDEERAVARLYGCWDRASLDKLYEIASAHGLKLHTEKTKLFNARIYSDTGVYENGSSTREGFVELDDGKRYFFIYTELSGYLSAEELTTNTTDEFEEWSYTTARGDNVSIAMLEQSRDSNGHAQYLCLVFWNGKTASVTVSLGYGGDCEDTEARRSFAERIADGVDFQSYAKGEQP